MIRAFVIISRSNTYIFKTHHDLTTLTARKGYPNSEDLTGNQFYIRLISTDIFYLLYLHIIPNVFQITMSPFKRDISRTNQLLGICIGTERHTNEF